MTTMTRTAAQEAAANSRAQPQFMEGDGAARWYRVNLASDPENPVEVYGRLKLIPGWFTIMEGNVMVYMAPAENVDFGLVPR